MTSDHYSFEEQCSTKGIFFYLKLFNYAYFHYRTSTFMAPYFLLFSTVVLIEILFALYLVQI